MEKNNCEQNYTEQITILASKANDIEKEIPQEQNQTVERMADIVQIFLSELREYSSRASEAEKKLLLLEDSERKTQNQFCETSAELKKLQAQLEEKEEKLKDYENQKKRAEMLEIQLKLLQLKQNNKKFWEFWK